jgi:hypothetical protein
MFGGSGQCQRRFDARLRDIFLAIYALGVNLEENIYAVPGPFGDLGWWDPGIKPGRYSSYLP